MSKETEEDEAKMKLNAILHLENDLEIMRKNLLLAISNSIEWIANIQVIKTGLYKHRSIPPNYYIQTIESLTCMIKESEKLIKICRNLKKIRN